MAVYTVLRDVRIKPALGDDAFLHKLPLFQMLQMKYQEQHVNFYSISGSQYILRIET